MAAQVGEAKVALVTGGSSGIGEATAILLLKKGYKIAISGSNQTKVDRAVARCSELSLDKPLGLVLDFSEPNNGRVAVEKTIETFGRLDALVNNAGIFDQTPGDNPNTYETYRKLMTINMDASVQCSLAAVEHLKRTNGNMIFVSSVASVKVHPQSYAYCMSKASMSMFAKCLAVDLAPNVRVNIVSPGPIKTEIMQRGERKISIDPDMMSKVMKDTTLQERIGLSEEVAEAVYFLVADTGSFINGHELFIDGGYMLKMKRNPVMESDG